VMRMTGTVSSGIDEIDLQPGSHVCAFYRGDSDRDRLLTGYRCPVAPMAAARSAR